MAKPKNRRKRRERRTAEARARYVVRREAKRVHHFVTLRRAYEIIRGGNPLGVSEWTLMKAHGGFWAAA